MNYRNVLVSIKGDDRLIRWIVAYKGGEERVR